MKNVIFTGYYGMKNYGDDLFGVVSAYGAKTWWPEYSPTILAPPIAGQRERFSVPGFISADRYASEGTAGKLIRTFFSAKELLSGGRLVFSGGSLFSSNRSRIMNLAERVSKISGKRFSAIGVSIGPFDSRASEEAVAAFLRHFEYVSVRDRASYELLEGYGIDGRIALGRDLAGITPALAGPVAKPDRERPVLGYSSCHIGHRPETSRRIDDLFVDAVSRRRDLQVKVFNLNSHPVHGDDERSRYVLRRLKDANVAVELVDYAHTGVIETWRQIAACDAMVSIRLHGAITAYLCSVPFILFEYHKKCSDFLDDIGQTSSLRAPTDEAALISLAAGGFEQQLDILLGKPAVPTLEPARYSAESISHFTEAPWATPSAAQRSAA